MTTTTRAAGKDDLAGNGLFRPGYNCMSVSQADRVKVLVDAAEYYADLCDAMAGARSTIRIVGWDFDGRIRLRPDEPESLQLGEQLRKLADDRPDLKITILVWSMALFHASSGTRQLLVGEAWQEHPRIEIRLDRRHPVYASHHQKIVTIDDRIAYCGGVDLTVGRWDTHQHLASNGLRCDPEGVAYEPVHDVQMRVEGPVAGELATIARQRWQAATGGGTDNSPPQAATQIAQPQDTTRFPHTIAIARTIPSNRGTPATEEAARMTEDLLPSARRQIYIENQYFCSRALRQILGKMLQLPVGPEIVVVTGRKEEGVVERWIMGKNRRRLIRWLRRMDVHGRFRIYYPTVEGAEEPCHVLVHSKVMVIDDTFLRVGSANLNNRSTGLDSECDLVLRADGTISQRIVSGTRDRLLAEHLGVSQEQMSAAIARYGLIGAVENFNLHQRKLNPFDTGNPDGPTGEAFGTAILDPARRII